MQSVTIVFVCVCVVAVWGQNSQLGQGDITGQLKNRPYVEKQIKCVLDKGPCDRLGRQLKSAIPVAIEKNCKTCTKQQASNARKLVTFLEKNYPQEYKELNAKYRPKAKA